MRCEVSKSEAGGEKAGGARVRIISYQGLDVESVWRTGKPTDALVCFLCLRFTLYLSRLTSFQPVICFSRISSSVLQSMHWVAVGRASKRRMPISTPQESQ